MLNIKKPLNTLIDLKSLKSEIQQAKNIKNKSQLFEHTWKIRADLEYYTALISLELNEEDKINDITKTIRIKKEERDISKILNRVEDQIKQLNDNKPINLHETLNNLWKARELMTILIREIEPKKEEN
ncbi:MAG: hypothetical protein ACTSYR_04560 [Candidatus Odinarchaeia archaeon]